MATAWCSPIFSLSASSSSNSSSSSSACLKAKSHRLVSTSSRDSLRHVRPDLRSSRPSVSRVRATILQDKEEKVKVEVEESFPSQTSTQEVVRREPSEVSSSSSSVESMIIKLEQSVNIFLTDSVIKVLDTFYHNRNYARFYVLETIARVPYFAFMSVLHMYESFGWWRRADYIKVHFAESWNEMHHLLIMEELGGNSWWFDRFLSQIIAFFYYVMTVVMYTISPRMAYHFSECVENHAYSTYDKFLKAEGDKLKTMPAPEIAVKYYTGDDLYLFDEFQTSRPPNTRRPKIENLYDVFLNIRDDEAEHCKTMKACQTHGNLRSPHSYLEDEFDDEQCEGIVDCITKSVSTPSKAEVTYTGEAEEKESQSKFGVEKVM